LLEKRAGGYRKVNTPFNTEMRVGSMKTRLIITDRFILEKAPVKMIIKSRKNAGEKSKPIMAMIKR
jgi:hypothetical protein